MSDNRRVERLEDWFDSLIVAGSAPAWSAALAGRLSAAANGGAADRGAGPKRPLVLVADDAAPPLPVEPFKVYVGLAPGGAAAASCDLVLSPAVDEGAVVAAVRSALRAPKRLNVLVLYNDVFTHIESTREHLKALQNHSRHSYFFMPAQETVEPPGRPGRRFAEAAGDWPQAWDFSLFDAVVWHYVLPAYKSADHWPSDYISEAVLDALAAYDGLKVLFVQDEYDHTHVTWRSIRRAGIDLVMTVVPEPSARLAYPEAELPGVEVISSLTGYVPDDVARLGAYAKPLDQRAVRIAYRGRALPLRFGALGREKLTIGVQMKAMAEARGVPVDIAWTEDKRIYGDDWYRFLGSARATLATESGANIFDFDGSLAAAEASGEITDYDAFAARHLQGREGEVRQNQVSPKVFEAIALRTALVCFEGEYSGVIQPDRHFIPLKKDFSNADTVFAKLEDIEGLRAMTEQAYRDVIESGRYSYAAFVDRFDGIIEGRVGRPARAEIISAPIVARRRGSPEVEAIAHPHPFDYILNTGVLGGGLQRRRLEAAMGQARDAEFTPRRQFSDRPPADARSVFKTGPDGVRCYDYWRNAGATLEVTQEGARIATPAQAWHYAAGVPLDLSGIDFDAEHAWVRLAFQDVTGELLVALYDAGADALSEETALPTGGRGEVLLRVQSAKDTLLLLRTGSKDSVSTATLIETDVYAASILHPGLLAACSALRSKAEGTA